MYITQFTFTIQPGKAGAARLLFRELKALLNAWHPASTELLANPQEPDEMMIAVRFRDEDTAWSAAESAGHCDWYVRLVGLAERGPAVEHYQVMEVAC